MALHPAPSVLVKDVLIYNGLGQPESELQDILVLGGHISAIGTGLTEPEGAIIIEGKGAAVIPGLFDMLANCGEPRHEHLETFSSLSDTALAGGFTGIAIAPNADSAKTTTILCATKAANMVVIFIPLPPFHNNKRARN